MPEPPRIVEPHTELRPAAADWARDDDDLASLRGREEYEELVSA